MRGQMTGGAGVYCSFTPGACWACMTSCPRCNPLLRVLEGHTVCRLRDMCLCKKGLYS